MRYSNSSYVALKIYVTDENRDDELNVYKHLNPVNWEHPSRKFIRKRFDHFIITGPHGQHICLVHEPLGISASELLEWIPGKAMTLEDMKVCIRQCGTSYILQLVRSTRVRVDFAWVLTILGG